MKISCCFLIVAEALDVARPPATSRRSLFAAAAASLSPRLLPARADVPTDPFNSMCLGFGCNSVQGVDRISGAPKPTDEDSIAWLDFLKALDDNRVARVDFVDVTMRKAYAVLKDGQQGTTVILIGEGYPIEVGNSWSSTAFVARILQNRGIGYTFLNDLKRKSPAPPL